MVAVNSIMTPLGEHASGFSLWDPVAQKKVALEDFAGSKGFLIVFMCNHCPFVKHLMPHLPNTMAQYQQKGIATIAINSNDVSHYPDDSPAHMVAVAQKFDFKFPYLFDENQSVAKEYQAMCTPDFFLYDAQRTLLYRGQYDDSRPGNGKPVTGKDLCMAMDLLLEGKRVPHEFQRPSIGCNIKWIKGSEPLYYKKS